MSNMRKVLGWIVQGLVSLVIVVVPRPAPAAVPESDIRNTETADFKTHFKMPDYRSRKQWEERRSKLRQQILSAAGLLPMPVKTPLRPRIVRRLNYQDYSIEVVLIETLPGYYLGGNLYRPIGKTVPAPAVLLPHGHWKRGRLEDQPSYSVPALGINLARQGYVVHGKELIQSTKALMLDAKTLHDAQPNLPEDDPRVKSFTARLQAKMNEAQKMTADFKAVVDEGRDRAVQAVGH